jgi:hypothetical protein
MAAESSIASLIEHATSTMEPSVDPAFLRAIKAAARASDGANGMTAASWRTTQRSMKTTDTSDATGILKPWTRASMVIPCWMKVVVICPSDAAYSTQVAQMGSIRTRIFMPSTSLTLISHLQGKIVEKSRLYEDEALQNIFLMNNLLYIVQKVKDSELKTLLGDNWIRKRRGKIRLVFPIVMD